MLVGFALANYTCYRDRQEFSAEAVAGTAAAWAFDTGVRRFPRLNRVSAIYGPNGSGKSRFVEALAFAKRFVVSSSKESQAGEEIPHRPFLFDSKRRGQPTTFELSFIESGTVYEYGFAVDRRRVHAEWLLAWPPGGRMRQLLERTYDSETDSERWTFGPSVRGPKQVWRSSTRPNSLLVSAAAQLNGAPFRPVVDWCNKLIVVKAGDVPLHYTTSRIVENDGLKRRIMTLLGDADIAVTDVAVSTEEGSDKVHAKDVSIGHQGSNADTCDFLELDEESDGTQRLFSLAGPWIEVMDNDRVIVVDELDRSLHPLLAASLIRRLNGEPAGGGNKRAQLVATLHDTTLLDDVLERGQIWLTEKEGRSEAARLRPLSDFRPQPREALTRGYLGGRYGGVPVVVETES